MILPRALSSLPAVAAGLLGAGAVILGLALSCTPLGTADGGSAGPPCASVVSDACVLPQVARDNEAHMAWADTLVDVSHHCGVAQDTVTAEWAAHTQAEAIEGFAPKPPPTGDR
jgi:hypothetical protein